MVDVITGMTPCCGLLKSGTVKERQNIDVYKKGNKMKKLLLGTVFSGLVLVFPVPTMAEVNVDINISLPPLIVFEAPPEMIVIPETYVYVVPDVGVDIFFYNGWWYRPWEERWYRSRNYNSGWKHYRKVPSFYKHVPSGWRNDYREHRWGGHQWNYQRIPHKQVQGKWNYWKKTNHWEKQQTWGVQDLHNQSQQQQGKHGKGKGKGNGKK